MAPFGSVSKAGLSAWSTWLFVHFCPPWHVAQRFWKTVRPLFTCCRVSGLRQDRCTHRLHPQRLGIEGIARPLRDAVVVDGGIRWVASKPDTSLHRAGVVVEVRVAATRGAPQHQSLISRVILGEETVKRERLAWPIGEDPGYPISEAIRVTGATTAPAITRGFAFVIEWYELTNLGIKNAIVWHPKGGEERQFPNQHDVLEGVGPGWLTGSDIAAEDSIGVQRDGGDRDIHLVVCVGPLAILTYDHTIRDVTGLEADDVRGI